MCVMESEHFCKECSFSAVSVLLLGSSLQLLLYRQLKANSSIQVSLRDAGRGDHAEVTALAWQFKAEHLIWRAVFPNTPALL